MGVPEEMLVPYASENERAKVYASDSAPSDVFQCHPSYQGDGNENIELGIDMKKEKCYKTTANCVFPFYRVDLLL